MVDYDLEGIIIQHKLSTDSTVTVPAETTLAEGTVLGMVAGKYVPFDADATDGSENPTAVLYSEIVNEEVSAADVITRVLEIGRVHGEKLVFPDSSTIDTALASGVTVKVAMKQNGIIVEDPIQQLSQNYS